MKKMIFILVVWMLSLSCANNTNSNKENDTANIHTLDTAKGDSAGMKKDNTENKQNEDSLPPIQH